MRVGRDPARISQLDVKDSGAAGLAGDVAALLTAGLPRSMCPGRYFVTARVGARVRKVGLRKPIDQAATLAFGATCGRVVVSHTMS